MAEKVKLSREEFVKSLDSVSDSLGDVLKALEEIKKKVSEGKPLPEKEARRDEITSQGGKLETVSAKIIDLAFDYELVEDN